MDAVLHALSRADVMAGRILWVLVLGHARSPVVQAQVRRPSHGARRRPAA
ncbi:hypothetical protein ACIRO1_46515 [Streptomyces sp. NPDC102381]